MTRSESDANQTLQPQYMHIGRTFHVPGRGHYEKPRGFFAFLYSLITSF